MKKALFILYFLLLSIHIFAQTWTVRQDKDWDIEWKKITREQWNRLVEQKEIQNKYALLYFVDVLEEKDVQIIKGKSPKLEGLYYCLGTIIPRTDEARKLQNLTGYGQCLLYGNDQTGNFQIFFLNELGSFLPGAIKIKSREYINRYDQYIMWVKGE